MKDKSKKAQENDTVNSSVPAGAESATQTNAVDQASEGEQASVAQTTGAVQTQTTAAVQTQGQTTEAVQSTATPFERFLASIAGTTIKYPLYVDKDGGLCECEFTGPCVLRATDLLFSKAKSGAKQVLVRGVVVEDVVSDPALMTPEERAASPQGFTCYSLRAGSDARGFVGYSSVVGYPFVTALNLAEGFPIENATNTLRALGWTGRSFRDFVPAAGEQTVPASRLGMDGEMDGVFVWKDGDEAKGFAARAQLNKVTPRKNVGTTDDADICDKMFEDYVAASMVGRVDTKKKSVEGAAARIFGTSQAQAKPPGTVVEAPRSAGPPKNTPRSQAKPAATAEGQGGGAGAQGSTGGAQGGTLCGKMIKGEGGRICSKAPGHQGSCGLLPFP